LDPAEATGLFQPGRVANRPATFQPAIIFENASMTNAV
jgi:hypothetical protein